VALTYGWVTIEILSMVKRAHPLYSNKEDHAWRDFLFGGWINPSLTHVHPSIVEHSMWVSVVGYLYGLMPLFSVRFG
jgi:hypothetical protein